MSNGKPCVAHNMPRDICARCVGAKQEYERLMAILHKHMVSNQNEPKLREGLTQEEQKGYQIGVYMESHRILNMLLSSE